MKQKFLWDRLPAALLLLSLTLFSAGSLAAEAEEEHEEEEEGNAESATINPAMAQQAGITTAAASPGVILDAITVYGRTVIDPRGISHIRARFPGLVISIEPGIGDLVAAGDAVLEIESSESLNNYVIRAPITGIVTARNANPGETTGDEPLLTLANYDQLWAELAVFPLNAGRIKIGQEVILRTNAQEIRSSVAHILPGTPELPAIVARVPLDNRDALWSPGLLMQADVIIGQADVARRLLHAARQRGRVAGQQQLRQGLPGAALAAAGAAAALAAAFGVGLQLLVGRRHGSGRRAGTAHCSAWRASSRSSRKRSQEPGQSRYLFFCVWCGLLA